MAKPRILVVEDEMLIAMDVEAMVRDLGFEVVGPVGNVATALDRAAAQALDGAILDVNLRGERVWAVADLLADKGVPFVLGSGYTGGDVPERFQARPIVAKPLTLATLRAGLRDAGII